MPTKLITIKELLATASDDFPKHEAEIILANLLKRPRTYLLAHPEKKLGWKLVRQFNQHIARRERGEPLAYIFGQTYFYKHEFLVDKRVLIPRPETEWLVEAANATLKQNPEIGMIIDVGTGSGAIVLSIYKSLPPSRCREIKWLATDYSASALTVARLNARRLKVSRVVFQRGDLLQPSLKKISGLKVHKKVLLLANLPYLPNADYKKTPVEVFKFEPKQALVAGPDGLKFYNRLIKQVAKLKREVICFFEIDPGQAAAIKKSARSLGAANIQKDFNGRERYLVLHANSPQITPLHTIGF
jgi:release factor glutamine methyltransferase